MVKRIAFLGPKGTFTEEALGHYITHKGWQVELQEEHTIDEAIEETMQDKTDYAFVPIENSLGGTVLTTMDYLTDHRHIEICGEIVMPIRHYVWGMENTELSEIRDVYSHPQAIRQCKPFILTHMKEAEIHYTGSTAEGGTLVAEAGDASKAVIGGIALGQTYGLTKLSDEAQENTYNLTRFVLVRHNENPVLELSEQSKGRKLSLQCELDGLRPGALWECLGIFAKRHINLLKIESRPTKGRLGEYKFFFDLQIESNGEAVKEALAELETMATNIQLFGVYHTIIIE